jgi:phage tail sheath protein FI
MSNLINHAERMRYRIAVLDCPPRMGIADVRKVRAKLDSTHAAFYYPWVKILDPVTRRELDLPPSGFVAGIYARNDIERAVFKAPANEVVSGAIGFEQTINKAQQDVLNPEGINCFRFFEGRGFRLWGARTISSEPEWKYVNLRRYFAYLERSIDKGTQWAVFEPNGEALWANVRETVSAFLYNEWVSGALLGATQQEAFFVRCDRSTMTQADLDNGATFVIEGDILDDSFGSKHVRQEIKLNDPLHVSAVQTDATGSFVIVSFAVKDLAGNASVIHLRFTVSATATLIEDIGIKNLPTIAASITLQALLNQPGT